MKSGRVKFYHIYFLLAAFDVLALCVSLLVNHRNLAIFEESIIADRSYIRRLELTEELGGAIAEVNAPGNDVFDSQDVALESQRVEVAEKKYRSKFLKFQNFEFEIANEESAQIKSQLVQINKAFDEMKSVAQTIFDAFKRHDQKFAGSMMATMDQKYAALNKNLSELRATISQFQSKNLNEQGRNVARLADIDRILSLFILIIVGVVAAYGHRLGKIMETQSKTIRDRESQILDSQKLASMGAMSAAIVHEIQNPLSVISGKTYLIQSRHSALQVEDDQLKKSVESINSMCERIQTIIKGIKNLSHGEDNDVFEKVKFKMVLNETMTLAQAKTKVAGISIVIPPFEDTEMECRPVQISQVILNLISNSVDAIEKLGERWIQVNCMILPGRLQIFVTDSGKGLPPEVAEKLMSPFFTTKDRGKGTGLGLSICKRIIESHNGTLKYNPDSTNTQFIITLPLSQPVVEKMAS